MRKLLFIAVLCAAAGAGVARGADFTGQIMDSQCADMGSHENMMKGMHASNAKDCAIACVKEGGTYALYDAAGKKAYKLDNQKKAREFAGQTVTVSGKLDSAGDSIKVTDIKPGS